MRSLALAFIMLFLASFAAHAFGGLRQSNEERMTRGLQAGAARALPWVPTSHGHSSHRPPCSGGCQRILLRRYRAEEQHSPAFLAVIFEVAAAGGKLSRRSRQPWQLCCHNKAFEAGRPRMSKQAYPAGAADKPGAWHEHCIARSPTPATG